MMSRQSCLVHAGLPNARVTGTWSDGATGLAECTTDASGQCSVTKANQKASVGFVTFTATGVTHPTDSYNWADNHDPIGEQPNVTVLAP